MRCALLMLPLLLVSACQKQPKFDERFDTAAKDLESRAKAMDDDIAEAEKAAKAAGEAVPDKTGTKGAP